MKIAWKIFRAVVSVILLLAVLVPAALYVLLSVESVQRGIKNVATTELSRLLGAKVGIDRIMVRPFNRLSVRGMGLCLENGDTVAAISTVSAGFELYHFLRTGELVIDYALVDEAQLNIWRDSIGAPLNVAPILEHLRSDKPREEKPFDLKINTVVLRHGEFRYDVLSEPEPEPTVFSPHHIEVGELALNAYIPA